MQIIFGLSAHFLAAKTSPPYMHTARRKKRSFAGNSARNLKSFFGGVFSQDKASNPPLYTHTARRKKRSFTGSSARTSAHFTVMFFRKTRKINADVQAYFKRNLTQYSGNSARTSNHFSAMFFRKTRLLSRRCICIPQGARNEVLRKNSPKNQISIMSASFFFAISSISLTYLSVIF